MRCVTVVEPAGCVDLVRRLVLGEADVAVDTEHRSLRISADLRRELRKARVEILDQLAHWLAYFRLVLVAMRLEPGLLVVPGESTKETQSAIGEGHAQKICRFSALFEQKLVVDERIVAVKGAAT